MEIIEDLVLGIFKMGTELTKGIINSNFKSKSKIEYKLLKSKKITKNRLHIAYSPSAKKNIFYKDIDLSKHNLVVGASRSGKSNLLNALILNSYQTKIPFCLIDPKGDRKSLETIRKLSICYGQIVQIFSNQSNSIKLNPLRSGDVVAITDRIMNAFSWSEVHYKEQCYTGLKKAVQRAKEEEKCDFFNILFHLERIADNKDDLNLLRLKGSELTGIINRIKNLVESPFGDNLKETPDTTSLGEIWEEKETVIIDLPVLVYPVLARALGKMLLGELYYKVGETYQKAQNFSPFNLYVDELGSFITDDYIELLNKCLGAKLSITSALQTLSDIDRTDKDLTKQILVNTHNWFIFNQATEESASYFSDSIGTVETIKRTTQTKDQMESDRGSARSAREFLVHSDIIKNLNIGQCIMRLNLPKRVELLNTIYIDPKVIEQDLEFRELQFSKQIKKQTILKEINKPINIFED